MFSASPRVHAGQKLCLTDMLPGLLVPGGTAIGYGAVTTAVVTTTKLLIITTVVINRPHLIGRLVVGTPLACFGVYRLSDLKKRLKQRFDKTVTGQLKEGLIGLARPAVQERDQTLNRDDVLCRRSPPGLASLRFHEFHLDV